MSTNDSRSQPLVFKASIYGLRSDLLLVDFRRSTVSPIVHTLVIYMYMYMCTCDSTCICIVHYMYNGHV